MGSEMCIRDRNSGMPQFVPNVCNAKNDGIPLFDPHDPMTDYNPFMETHEGTTTECIPTSNVKHKSKNCGFSTTWPLLRPLLFWERSTNHILLGPEEKKPSSTRGVTTFARELIESVAKSWLSFRSRISKDLIVFLKMSRAWCQETCGGVKVSRCQKICYGVRRYVYVPRNVPFCYRVTKVVFYTFYVYFSSDPMKSITPHRIK